MTSSLVRYDMCSACSRMVASHFDHHGRKLTCEELAERDAAVLAAAACTTAETAQLAVAHAATVAAEVRPC